MTRTISDLSFEHVGILRLERDVDGRPMAYRHRLRPDVKPNRHAAGPFCDFELLGATTGAGVYALSVGDEIKYIGECESLDSRFGPVGYGHVSHRNCHIDGQATNCKINSLVLQVSQGEDRVQVWFLTATAARKSIESRLIRELNPPWNGRTLSGSRVDTPSLTSSGTRASGRLRDRFGVALREIFANAQRSGQRAVRVRAGDLHRRVGGYPGPSHKMPQCCRAMRDAMSEADVIIESPPRGAGASLVIEYCLPRPDSLSNIAMEPAAPKPL
jgi:hypothetical protein